VASRANPGEGERFKQLSKDYTSQHGVQVTWQQVVGDYQSKLLTQLAGGSAPDAFYVGDSSMAPMIASDKLEKLDDFLGSAESPVKIDDVYGACTSGARARTVPGPAFPSIATPTVFWFNKEPLQEAGVTTDPAAAFAGGTWNRDALDDHGGSLPKGARAWMRCSTAGSPRHPVRPVDPANLWKLPDLQYDIAPMPSEDGKTIFPAAV
jgi:multiple sugar transport system substrate-binding protein